MSKKKIRDGEVTVVTKEAEVAPKRKLPEPAMPVMTFDAWWVQAQRKHGFEPHLKEALCNHFKARGFLKSGRFDDGLKDFGF